MTRRLVGDDSPYLGAEQGMAARLRPYGDGLGAASDADAQKGYGLAWGFDWNLARATPRRFEFLIERSGLVTFSLRQSHSLGWVTRGLW